jgi:hypothetical protein
MSAVSPTEARLRVAPFVGQSAQLNGSNQGTADVRRASSLSLTQTKGAGEEAASGLWR